MNINDIKNSLLVEKYRPDIDTIILPKVIKDSMKNIIDENQMIPHLLFSGKTGCGKTSLGYILAEMTNANVLYINASLENTVDVMKNEIIEYCKRSSVNNKRYKIVLLDEIDHHHAKNLQKNVLSPMERYSASTRFILTCNRISALPEELIGRCQTVEFKYMPEETKELKLQFIKRLVSIFDAEGIEYDIKALAFYTEKTFPNMRMAMNNLHWLSKSGKITEDAVKMSVYHDVDTFFNILRSKDDVALRKYAQVMNAHTDDFYRQVYNSIEHHVKTEDIPSAIIMTYNYHKDSKEYPDQFMNIRTYGVNMMDKIRFR